MNISEIARVMIKSLRENYPGVVGVDPITAWPDYIKQFRTIGLATPRQRGKSELIKKLSEEHSCLVLAPNRHLAKSISTHAFTIDTLRNHFIDIPHRGNRGMYRGLKYQCLLIDEYDWFTEGEKEIIDRVILIMATEGIITDDFFVFYVTTPR